MARSAVSRSLRPGSRRRRTSLPAPRVPRSSRPLFLTTDEVLLDDLLRLAAAAGLEAEVARDPAAARAAWAGAPLVVVGDDVAASAARTLPRRDAVALAALDLDDAGVWRRAVDLGAHQVAHLPSQETELLEFLAGAGRRVRGPVVGVVGGRGGAGASVLAAGLAVTAAGDAPDVLLVDLDPLGGGLDLLLGDEGSDGLRWGDVAPSPSASAVGRDRGDDDLAVDVERLRALLPRPGGVSVLAWRRGDDGPPPPVDAVAAVVVGGSRGGSVVVVDLPRAQDERSRAALTLCDTVVLVVPCEVRAVAAAQRVLADVVQHCPDIRLVARLPEGGVSPDLVADVLGLPLGGVLAPEPHLDTMLEHGVPPACGGRGPLAVLCRDLLAELVPEPAGAGHAFRAAV